MGGEGYKYEPGLGPVGGFAEKDEPTDFDIENLALLDPDTALAREVLRNDPSKGVIHLGDIPEFDQEVSAKLTTGEYLFYVNESNVIRFVAVSNEAGLLTISKMAKAIEGLERKPELPN